ncbi:hypothetical protein KUCAC02_029119, partial [Chaenocephalus aceratus]
TSASSLLRLITRADKQVWVFVCRAILRYVGSDSFSAAGKRIARRDGFSHTLNLSPILFAWPRGGCSVARSGPALDGCDVEALGLCWREAGATT